VHESWLCVTNLLSIHGSPRYPLAIGLDPHAHLFAGLNCNDQRNCFEAGDKVEDALARNRLEAIAGIDADDE
jgi:hypothetical protein